MLTAIMPDPHGPDFRHEVYGSTPEALVKAVREAIEFSGYGASDIGSRFNVYKDGKQIAYVTYNGRYIEGENKPPVHGGDWVLLEEGL